MNIDPLDIVLRLAAAALVGCALGVNRELRDKAAGMRTHGLVAIGAALFTITAALLSQDDPTVDAMSRVIQGVVAGVGFLGAGAILKAENTHGVRGLTTAASIWVVASLGVACGAGYWVASLIALGITLAVLVIGEPIERALRKISSPKQEEE